MSATTTDMPAVLFLPVSGGGVTYHPDGSRRTNGGHWPPPTELHRRLTLRLTYHLLCAEQLAADTRQLAFAYNGGKNGHVSIQWRWPTTLYGPQPQERESNVPCVRSAINRLQEIARAHQAELEKIDTEVASIPYFVPTAHHYRQQIRKYLERVLAVELFAI